MQPDPNFPDRPMHRDFQVLSERIIALDAESEHTPVEQIVGQYVDLESVTYMAMNRVARVLFLGTPPTSQEDIMAKLASCWIDGFLLGVRCEHDKWGNR